MILDTSFIIDVMNGDSDAVAFYEMTERERDQHYLSSQTLFELHVGVERAFDSQAEREQVRDVVDSKAVLDADQAVMKKAGRLYGALVNEGRQIEPADCVIAATASIAEEPLLTRNVDHFSRIDDLDIRSY